MSGWWILSSQWRNWRQREVLDPLRWRLWPTGPQVLVVQVEDNQKVLHQVISLQLVDLGQFLWTETMKIWTVGLRLSYSISCSIRFDFFYLKLKQYFIKTFFLILRSWCKKFEKYLYFVDIWPRAGSYLPGIEAININNSTFSCLVNSLKGNSVSKL